MSINVPEIDIEFLRAKGEHIVDFMRTADVGASTDRWNLSQLSPYAESVYMARFKTHGERNKRSVSNIPVEEIEQLQRPGFYVAVMKAPAEFEYSEKTSYYFVSDIGLHVRKYDNRVEIVASSLKTGLALPDVRVFVYAGEGDVLHKGYTDEKSRLSISGFAKKPFLIVASLDKHVSFVSIEEPALDLSAFQIGGPVFKPMEIFVYGPRDLYRPGETVDFSALLRNHDGKPVAEILLNARIRRPDGREVSRFSWRPEVGGYYHRAFGLPDDSPTGKWSLELRTDPADQNPSHVYDFKVEEFLPERMKLTLETDRKTIAPGEEFLVEVTGELYWKSFA